MSNKRITDLTELTTPTTDDVFPVVDIATNTTTKVQLGNLPVPTSVTTALATKQDTLVSGTNIKTVNSTSLLGSGNVAVQETLVSGTNIKTINSTSLLGSGDIVIAANPSGVAGAIQFSNGSAFASDAANLFWDDTNNRLGIGTNAPTQALDVIGAGRFYQVFAAGIPSLFAYNGRAEADSTLRLDNPGGGKLYFGGFGLLNETNAAFGQLSAPSARVHIKGSGSTSATTSLLVQNSAGTAALTIKDDLTATFGNGVVVNGAGGGVTSLGNAYTQIVTRGGQILASFYNSGGTEATSGVLFGYNISTTIPNSSAMLDVASTTKGFLPPRMTTTQKNAIASPAAGLVVYDSTTNKLCCYNGSTWNDLF